MSDPVRAQTGIVRAELLELKRRIADRGLQLRCFPPHQEEGARWNGLPPERLTDYEVAVICAALMAAASIAP